MVSDGERFEFLLQDVDCVAEADESVCEGVRARQVDPEGVVRDPRLQHPHQPRELIVGQQTAVQRVETPKQTHERLQELAMNVQLEIEQDL